MIVWMWMYFFSIYVTSSKNLTAKKSRVKDRSCKTHHFMCCDTFPGRLLNCAHKLVILSCWIASIYCAFMINIVCNAMCSCAHNSKHFYIVNHKNFAKKFSLQAIIKTVKKNFSLRAIGNDVKCTNVEMDNLGDSSAITWELF